MCVCNRPVVCHGPILLVKAECNNMKRKQWIRVACRQFETYCRAIQCTHTHTFGLLRNWWPPTNKANEFCAPIHTILCCCTRSHTETARRMHKQTDLFEYNMATAPKHYTGPKINNSNLCAWKRSIEYAKCARRWYRQSAASILYSLARSPSRRQSNELNRFAIHMVRWKSTMFCNRTQ